MIDVCRVNYKLTKQQIKDSYKIKTYDNNYINNKYSKYLELSRNLCYAFLVGDNHEK